MSGSGLRPPERLLGELEHTRQSRARIPASDDMSLGLRKTKSKYGSGLFVFELTHKKASFLSSMCLRSQRNALVT